MIISDIDGTLLAHMGSLTAIEEYEAVLLPGVLEKLNKWKEDGHYILLVTGRPERMRLLTISQLSQFHIPYDNLIMGVGNDARYLINDTKPYLGMDETCYAITIKRDDGLKNIDI